MQFTRKIPKILVTTIPSASSKKISLRLQELLKLNIKVGVIIIDSDGRIEKTGATHIGIIKSVISILNL